MKHKVGDKVKIREDLIEGERYGDNDTVDNMMKYVGKIATITGSIHNPLGVRLDIDNGAWNWTDEMFDQNYISKWSTYMKTSDLKKKLNSITGNYNLERKGFKWLIFKERRFTKDPIATINAEETNKFNVYFQNKEIPNDIRCDLFNLINRYASTPIAERKDEPKLFNVQIIKGKWGEDSWLYRDYEDKATTSSSTDNNDLNQQWTLEQIKEYGIDDEIVYKRVPVED